MCPLAAKEPCFSGNFSSIGIGQIELPLILLTLRVILNKKV